MQLDPELKKGGWTEDEDRKIVAAHTHTYTYIHTYIQ